VIARHLVVIGEAGAEIPGEPGVTGEVAVPAGSLLAGLREQPGPELAQRVEQQVLIRK
jgi:hypothetical protein